MSLTIEPALLAPLEIWEVPLDDSTIKFNKPLVVNPTIFDRGTPEECFYAECHELDISAVRVDLDELSSCLRSDIRMTWKRVVQKQNNKLTAKELATKQRFLEIAEEVCDG